MAKTKLAKKRRLARAHAHQSKTRTSMVDLIQKRLEQPLTPWQADFVQKVIDGKEERARVRDGRALAGALSTAVDVPVYVHTPEVGEPTVTVTEHPDLIVNMLQAAGPVTRKDVRAAVKAEQAERVAEAYGEQPSRARCPKCGFSQKVRKDGTMSRHDVYLGDAPQECDGTGKRWDAA